MACPSNARLNHQGRHPEARTCPYPSHLSQGLDHPQHTVTHTCTHARTHRNHSASLCASLIIYSMNALPSSPLLVQLCSRTTMRRVPQRSDMRTKKKKEGHRGGEGVHLYRDYCPMLLCPPLNYLGGAGEPLSTNPPNFN